MRSEEKSRADPASAVAGPFAVANKRKVRERNDEKTVKADVEVELNAPKVEKQTDKNGVPKKKDKKKKQEGKLDKRAAKQTCKAEQKDDENQTTIQDLLPLVKSSASSSAFGTKVIAELKQEKPSSSSASGKAMDAKQRAELGKLLKTMPSEPLKRLGQMGRVQHLHTGLTSCITSLPSAMRTLTEPGPGLACDRPHGANQTA